jgi:7,8-dihydropterin-6-yl-methyl-4-(beta-D-ribofuranosyl)aminobenzene 5'-phosphate synthase
MLENLGVIDSIRIVTLVDNSPKYDSYLMGCFGISFWVEVRSANITRRILFDTGPLSEVLIHNAHKLNIELRDIDMIVLSHCHFDHTAALKDIVSLIGRDVAIFAHPDIFRPSFVLKPEYMNYGLVGKNRRESIEALGGHFVLARNPMELLPGVFLSGEIERTTSCEERGGVACYTLDEGGNVVPDNLIDDMCMGFNIRDKGMVIITGCAHAGPVNTVKHSIKITGQEKVQGLMGGFHLLQASEQRIDETIEELKRLNPQWIAPMHCTGVVAAGKIALAFKDRYRQVNAGDIIEL